jgi:hypothetical protein
VSEPRVVRIEVAAHRSDGSVIHMSMSVESPEPAAAPPAPDHYVSYHTRRGSGENDLVSLSCTCGWATGESSLASAQQRAAQHYREFDPPPVHSTPPEDHRIAFHSRSTGFDVIYRATCSCGWESGDCSEVVAGWKADEHLRPFERIVLP